jgi:hypothetical protein
LMEKVPVSSFTSQESCPKSCRNLPLQVPESRNPKKALASCPDIGDFGQLKATAETAAELPKTIWTTAFLQRVQ